MTTPKVITVPVQSQRRVVSVTVDEFMQMELPERGEILAPWLPEQGLVMVHAPRGVGKTFFALNCAYAVATGGQFLSFTAPRPRSVLYIDGEMPSKDMQERIMRICHTNPAKDVPLSIITPDLQPKDQGTINLSDNGFQASLEPDVEKAELIIIDNISTLVHGGKENESDSWHTAQIWALRQRAAGRSVMWIHHSGKNGKQRGTSRREDVLDTTINLRHPSDYTPEQGAVFEIHYEKSRGFTGNDARPIEVSMQIGEDERQTWHYRNLDESTYDRVCDLANEGLKNFEIADELGINKSTASRHVKRERQCGDIHVPQSSDS